MLFLLGFAQRPLCDEVVHAPDETKFLFLESRKTGVVLPDGGQRDEHGMQPLDDIFSSPRKSRGSSSARSDRTRDETGSEDMDIASSE